MKKFAWRISEKLTGIPVGWMLRYEFTWLGRKWHVITATGCEFWLWTNRINEERKLQFGLAMGLIGITSNMVRQ
jgi:hypothetical protein